MKKTIVMKTFTLDYMHEIIMEFENYDGTYLKIS